MVGYAPIVLRKSRIDEMAQATGASACTQADLIGKSQHEIGFSDAAILPVEKHLTGQSLIAGIEDIGAVAINLRTDMKYMLADGPAYGVIRLDYGIGELVFGVVISECDVTDVSTNEIHLRKKGVGHTGNAKSLRQVLTGRIRDPKGHRVVAD